MAGIVLQGVLLEGGRGDAGALLEADRKTFEVVGVAALQGLGFALFAPLLVYLFRAPAARAERMLPGLVGLAAAGPVLLGAGIVALALGVVDAAEQFAERGGRVTDEGQRLADDLLTDAGLRDLGRGLSLAGLFATGAALLYTSLWAMRTGLLTRFWGSLGMAVGVMTAIGFIPGLVLFIVALALQVLGWWFEPRPPAWEQGRAIPWPDPRAAPEEPDEPEEESEPPEGPPEPSRRKRKRRN